MSDKPWSEHDKKMFEELKAMRNQALYFLNGIDFLTLKIQQKYEFSSKN